jgi:hypothetical protein
MPKPPVAQGNVPPRPPALAQAPRPSVPVAPPAAGAMNMTPDQDQLIAEEAARRKAFGITGEAGAAAEARMAGRRKQFEDAKPSGLDDLIRVFGQAGQYKGLSGLGPAYTSNEDRKRAQQAAFENQMEEQQIGIESARRTEGLGRATSIGAGLEKSRDVSSKEKIAREGNLTQIEAAKIQAAAVNHPGETERMMAEYGRLKKTDPAAAEQYLQNIGTIRTGITGKGVMTRDQAIDNVNKLLSNPLMASKMQKEAKDALMAAGNKNPLFSDILEYHVQKNMKPSSVLGGSATKPTSPSDLEERLKKYK